MGRGGDARLEGTQRLFPLDLQPLPRGGMFVCLETVPSPCAATWPLQLPKASGSLAVSGGGRRYSPHHRQGTALPPAKCPRVGRGGVVFGTPRWFGGISGTSAAEDVSPASFGVAILGSRSFSSVLIGSDHQEYRIVCCPFSTHTCRSPVGVCTYVPICIYGVKRGKKRRPNLVSKEGWVAGGGPR